MEFTLIAEMISLVCVLKDDYFTNFINTIRIVLFPEVTERFSLQNHSNY